MHLFTTHIYKLDKSTTTGSAVRYVVDTLNSFGLGDVPIGVYLRGDAGPYTSDLPRDVYFPDARNRQDPVCAQAIAAFPELHALVVDNQRRFALSNLGSQWRDDIRLDAAPSRAVRLSTETLLAIANGVPRRLAFDASHFIFGPVPFLELYAAPPRKDLSLHFPADSLAPLIVVESTRGSPRRKIRLHATVVTVAPSIDAKSLPALPEETARLTAALGKHSRVHQTLVGSDEERAALEGCHTRSRAIAEAFEALLDPAPLPHTLGHSAGVPNQRGSLKDAVASRLKPLGYRPVSLGNTTGVLRFAHRTKVGNVCIIDLHRTPIAGVFSASLTLSGPLWNLQIGRSPRSLPVSRDAAALAVRTEADCRAAAENLDVVVRQWEQAVVPAVEAIYGPGALWYTPNPDAIF
jgi:hypothetical protein